MAKNQKEYRLFFFSLFLCISSGLVIYHVIAHNFKTTGQWWRGRVMNSFVTRVSTIDTIYQVEYERHGQTAARHIHEIQVFARVHYNNNNKVFSTTIMLEKFPFLNFGKASMFINDFKNRGDNLTVFYDPAYPMDIVKSRKDIPGFFTSTSIIILNLIVLIVLIALFLMGSAGLYDFLKNPNKHIGLVKPISEKRKKYLNDKYFPKTEEIKTVFPERVLATELSGNSLEDYYSGALETNALQSWHGYYCEIFLFPGAVIVAFQGDKGYSIREYTLTDIIEKKYKTFLMDSFFGNDEQELEQTFFDAVAKQYNNPY